MNLDKREEITELFDKYSNFLTQNQKQIIHLYIIEDLSLKEISEIMATTRQSVHDTIKKAEANLKKVSEKMG